MSRNLRILYTRFVHTVFDCSISFVLFLFFFFNDTATTEIYTLSLHDALPISKRGHARRLDALGFGSRGLLLRGKRSEEHTSELQSHVNLVCRLLLEKKKKKKKKNRKQDT